MNPTLKITNTSAEPMVVRVYAIEDGQSDELKKEVFLRVADEFDLGAVLQAGTNYRIIYHHATQTPEQKDSGRYNRGVWLGMPGDASAGRPANPGYELGEQFKDYTITV